MARSKGSTVKILVSPLFEEELQQILQNLIKTQDYTSAKRFKTYLDALIINIPTKIAKYKNSLYIDDANVKDLEYDNFSIPFYVDESTDTYLVLSIIQKNS